MLLHENMEPGGREGDGHTYIVPVLHTTANRFENNL